MKKFLFLVVRLKFQKQIISKVTICALKFVSRTIPHSGGYNNLRFSFRFIPVILLISLVSFSPLHAASNNDDAPVTMEEVVVTATRDKQETRKAPANVTVITAEEISKSGATTVVDVLDKLESIQFRSSSSNSAQTLIDMRGFGGDNPHGKTLVMLDGRRLNRTDMYSINWLQTPVNTIERIEIVRGSGSVLYGDAAIGGVINIITKKGKGEPKFNASVLVGSYGLQNERVGVTGATDKWTYAVTGENNFSFGYRDRSKYSSQGGGFDVGYSANDLLNVSLGVSFNKVAYQMPGTLTKDQMERDRRQFGNPNDDGSDKYTNVNLGFKSFWGSWGQLEVNFLYGKKYLQTNMQSWFSYNDTNADTYGITPKYILIKNIFKKHEKYFILPKATPNSDPAWFSFIVTVKTEAPFSRNDFVTHLNKNKIETRNF